MADKATVEFEGCEGIQVSKSGLALLCQIEGKHKYIPLSVIHDDSEVYKAGTEGKLVIYEWFAVKEGLV